MFHFVPFSCKNPSASSISSTPLPNRRAQIWCGIRISGFQHLFKKLPRFPFSSFHLQNTFCVVDFICKFTPEPQIYSSNYLSNFVDFLLIVHFLCGSTPNRQICSSDYLSKFVVFLLVVDLFCGLTPNHRNYPLDSNFVDSLLIVHLFMGSHMSFIFLHKPWILGSPLLICII